MPKATYIGVNTNIPIYENKEHTATITPNNISNYFTITNGSYYFVGSGSTFTSNNAGVSSSTATTTLTAKQDISALSFNYSYSSERNYDKFTLKVAGTTIENAVSGPTTNKTYSGSLSSGQTIQFTYSKDGSVNQNDDKCTFSNMSVTCVGRIQTGSEIRSVARKVKNMYIGVNTNIPIYENRQQTVTITASNISNYFTVTNGAYYFAGSGSTFTTNNGSKDSTTATTTLTAKQDISALSFNYSYSSEKNYDKFTLKVAGTTVESAVSGATTSKTYSGSLSSGQTIEFTYAKDNSQSSNDDKCTFSNMSITFIGRVQTGSTTKSVAKKVKKGYIGVNGIARQFYSDGIPINTLSVGDIVQVAESGNYIDYIIVQIGTPASSKYSNADGYWLLRKQVELNGYFSQDDDGDSLANYTSSRASGYIRAKETLYYNRYGSYLKSVILKPTLPYYYFSASTADATIGSVTVNNVFHLGLAEVGSWFGESSTAEMKLTYFKNTASGRKTDPLRIAYDGSGNAQNWWTRDAGGEGAYQPGFITSGGAYSSSTAFTVYYRPCFIVPKTIMIEDLLR